MKTLTTSGLILGGVAALFSPELLAKLSGREVFWLLIAALVITSVGDSLLPSVKEHFKRKEDPK